MNPEFVILALPPPRTPGPSPEPQIYTGRQTVCHCFGSHAQFKINTLINLSGTTIMAEPIQLYSLPSHIQSTPERLSPKRGKKTKNLLKCVALQQRAPVLSLLLSLGTALGFSACPTLIIHCSQARSFKPSHIAAASAVITFCRRLKGTLHPGIKTSVRCSVTQNTQG